ncbi:MAG: RloB family protein [Sphaerochaeta sp.]|uniref:RloB family protein n=1 Tax=Sphaerochaeta sp. TaxID=1972642 RepID=UPI003D0C40E9
MRKRTLKKSIAIVGEGLTEWMYFDYIRRSEDILFLINQTYPSIRIFNTSSKKAKELHSQAYDLVFCVLDIDAILRERKFSTFQKICNTLPETIIPIVSNPCIEIWFVMHFLDAPQGGTYLSYSSIARELHRYMPHYTKTEAYFTESNFFPTLEKKNGLERAIRNANHVLANIDHQRDIA